MAATLPDQQSAEGGLKMAAKWTYRPEYHLGDPAFSLFDGDDRAAVGLTLADAKAACVALNSHAALLAALTRALPYVETAEADEAYKPGEVAKVTAMIRAAISQAEGEE